jgi:hypothetical protein
MNKKETRTLNGLMNLLENTYGSLNKITSDLSPEQKDKFMKGTVVVVKSINDLGTNLFGKEVWENAVRERFPVLGQAEPSVVTNELTNG